MIIVNDNTRRIEHWEKLNPGKDVIGFTHPNYLIEKATENTKFLSDYAKAIFIVDDFFSNKSLLHDESMNKIKSLFPNAKFYVSSGAHQEGKEISGYHGSIGPEPVDFDALMEKLEK